MARASESESLLNQEQEIPQSLLLARELEGVEDEAELKEKLGDLLDRISEDVGKQFTADVSELYSGMQSEKCLVRVDRLSRVLETIERNTPLHISDETDSHYANAVIPELEGIKIAFGEAQTRSPLRVMVGFGKTLIGFKTDHLSVEEVEFSDSAFRDAKERRYLCRHVSGNLEKDDIRYLVLRIPYTLLKDERITEEEKKRPRPFIFRGMRL